MKMEKVFLSDDKGRLFRTIAAFFFGVNTSAIPCFLLIAILQLMGVLAVEASSVELLSNTNFESGNNGIWTANTLAGSTAAGILQGSYPNSGTWYGYVGNSLSSIGSLYQIIYV